MSFLGCVFLFKSMLVERQLVYNVPTQLDIFHPRERRPWRSSRTVPERELTPTNSTLGRGRKKTKMLVFTSSRTAPTKQKYHEDSKLAACFSPTLLQSVHQGRRQSYFLPCSFALLARSPHGQQWSTKRLQRTPLILDPKFYSRRRSVQIPQE